MRALGAVVVAVGLLVGLPACEPARPVVIVYGDSLVWESTSELRQWAGTRGYDAIVRSRFGGAPCSLFAEMRADRALDPAAVIVAFAGNTDLAPCVGPDVVSSYQAQMTELDAIWEGTGARVVIGRVPKLPVALAEQVLDLVDAEADRLGMERIDGGTLVSPGGAYAWTQPCMNGEQCVGNQINRTVPPGRNIVRANDKVHLCPGWGQQYNRCPTYSSGAWRFARSLTSALTAPRSESPVQRAGVSG